MFLENQDTTIDVPLSCNDTVIGMIKFETYSNKEKIVTGSEDGKYPHVKQGCNVCKGTH